MPLLSFDTGTKVEIGSFNTLRVALVNLVSCRRQAFAVRLPIISVKSSYLAILMLFYQALTIRIRTTSKYKGSHLFYVGDPNRTSTILPPPGLHKRPELIDFQVCDAAGWCWFRNLCDGSPNPVRQVLGLMRNTRAVSRTPEPFNAIGTMNARPFTPLIDVLGYKLSLAIFAAIPLFLIGSFAILLDVQR